MFAIVWSWPFLKGLQTLKTLIFPIIHNTSYSLKLFGIIWQFSSVLHWLIININISLPNEDHSITCHKRLNKCVSKTYTSFRLKIKRAKSLCDNNSESLGPSTLLEYYFSMSLCTTDCHRSWDCLEKSPFFLGSPYNKAFVQICIIKLVIFRALSYF